jgi:integrase/recombinase XerC
MTAAKAVSRTPVEEELRRFDEHMEYVRGLAPGTRRLTQGIVRELLRERFRDRPIVFSSITPDHVRRLFSRVSERYRTPASTQALVAALMGYFRFRAVTGDPVHALIGVLSYPANWQQASLPKALADEEIGRLLKLS